MSHLFRCRHAVQGSSSFRPCIWAGPQEIRQLLLSMLLRPGTMFHFETITLHEASLSPQHLNVVRASDSSLRCSGPKELISLAPDHRTALNRCTSIYLLVAGYSPPAYKAMVLSLHLFVPITPHIDLPIEITFEKIQCPTKTQMLPVRAILC
jgi:hypothetical protein